MGQLSAMGQKSTADEAGEAKGERVHPSEVVICKLKDKGSDTFGE